jgi:hypothetical protein
MKSTGLVANSHGVLHTSRIKRTGGAGSGAVDDLLPAV